MPTLLLRDFQNSKSLRTSRDPWEFTGTLNHPNLALLAQGRQGRLEGQARFFTYPNPLGGPGGSGGPGLKVPSQGV